MKLLVIIPAYNEEKNIERVVDNLIFNYPDYDYIVINDGSKDDTQIICEQKNMMLLEPVHTNIASAIIANKINPLNITSSLS